MLIVEQSVAMRTILSRELGRQYDRWAQILFCFVTTLSPNDLKTFALVSSQCRICQKYKLDYNCCLAAMLLSLSG